MAYITLNKNNFYNNLDIITNKTKTKDKIALVLKDNAYGHGIIEIASMANGYGITKCVVQTFKEALQIEEYFDYILVLADFPIAQSDKIRYTINDMHTISKFPKGTRVELKVDTGMHRNGVLPDELYTAFARIKEHELILEAVFTHHRSADELSGEWFWQNEIFEKVKTHALLLVEEFSFDKIRFHSCNSASLFRTEDFNEDMVRVGIAAYGCMELPSVFGSREEFKPVLSLHSSKISTRKVTEGMGIGYGATYFSNKYTNVSNYDIGYGDGFFRAFSNNYKTPEGFSLVGRVSMDNSSFLSDDDSILVFNNASSAAKYVNTIAYEVLTSLKEGIKRSIV